MPGKVHPNEIRFYQQFVGKTVTKIEFTPTADVGFLPTLVFTDGTFAFVECDAEGNGPGFLRLCSAQGTELYPS